MVYLDRLGRPLRNIRLSVTDRCNLRCHYCMPESEYNWLPQEHILRFEEISELVDVFAELGVDRLHITGGEPLLRRELYKLIHLLAKKPQIRDIALTTNGVLLADHTQALLTAGLHRITISLDTLHPDRFKLLTGQDLHQQVLKGIEAAGRTGFRELKINTLVLRGTNDDELINMIEYGKSVGAEVRFIEYMDVGGATRWSYDMVFSRTAILDKLTKHYGPITPVMVEDSSPSVRFRLSDGTRFGIIASTTAPFCHACNRSRLTADGLWYLCLYANSGTDLRQLLRSGASKDEIKSIIARTWRWRQDHGAEERLQLNKRGPLYQIGELRSDPHLEMHTRGG